MSGDTETRDRTTRAAPTPILITGGAGFIGSNFVLDWFENQFNQTADNGESRSPIINLDKLTYVGNQANLISLAGRPDYKFVHGDICDFNLVKKLLIEYKPRAIIRFAAESHVDRSIAGPEAEAFLRTNINGTFTLLEAALCFYKTLQGADRDNFRFLHMDIDRRGLRYTLTHRPSLPRENPYSASKASSDHLVRAWHHTYGLPTLVTNCSNNYGPFHFPEKLIPLVITHALTGKHLPIYPRCSHQGLCW